jgi:hypothetical protein
LGAQSRKEPDVARTNTHQQRRRELANRVSNGIEVTLFWGPASGEVIDHTADYGYELSVSSECALDAFHHPYAYASRRGVEHEVLVPKAA